MRRKIGPLFCFVVQSILPVNGPVSNGAVKLMFTADRSSPIVPAGFFTFSQKSAFSLRLIAPNLAELSRSLDEVTLAFCSPFDACGAIAEMVNDPSRHVGRLALAPVTPPASGSCAGERVLRNAAKGYRPSWRIRLTTTPFVEFD